MSTNRNLHGTSDPHRPVFHFLPAKNWMNDPNGLIHWKGQYHMFYQYNPHGAFHGTIHWGHAISRDLVHWEHLPIALEPTPDGFDKDGCWSGCAVNNNGVPTLLYTGVYPQVQCIATSSDDLLTWQKHPQPIITAPPPDIELHAGGEIRDPFVWKENDQWYMVLGSRIEGVGGLILLYRSDDLFHWEYLHPLLAGAVNQTEPFWTGTMWECPNFLDFGERRALIISSQEHPAKPLYVAYFTGRYEDERFVPEAQEFLVHGTYFYAPQVMRADDGRYIMWGWLLEGRNHQHSLEAGWSGVMSLPINLSLRSDGKLALEPVQELEKLRQEHRHFENLEIAEGATLLEAIRWDALEIVLQFEPNEQTEIGIILCASQDGQEQTRVIFQAQERQLVLERSNPSPDVDIDTHVAPLSFEPHKAMTIHAFLDHSVLEVFVDRQVCMASRIYPAYETSNRIGLFSKNGLANIKSLDIWKLGEIWK
jgi:beta-fructofuranosidase